MHPEIQFTSPHVQARGKALQIIDSSFQAQILTATAADGEQARDGHRQHDDVRQGEKKQPRHGRTRERPFATAGVLAS